MGIRYIDFANGEDVIYQGSITDATRAVNCVLTIVGHVFDVGDRLDINGVSGMTQLNGQTYTVISITTDSVTLDVNSSGFGIYSANGTATTYRKAIQSITQANPAVVSSTNHGFTNGQQVWIDDAVGMTELNEGIFTVANATQHTFELSGINSTGYGVYSSGGRVTRPYYTHAFANNRFQPGDEIRVAKTTPASVITISDSTWTTGSHIVSTVGSHVGSVSVGDLIGTDTAAGNGADETYYYVKGVNATTITLEGYYGGITQTVSSIKKVVPVPTGPASGPAMYTNISVAISGGWTFGHTSTQDGETWFRPTGARTTSANTGIISATSGISYDKLNVGLGYYNYSSSQPDVTTNCSFSGGYVGPVVLSGTNWTFSNCRVTSSGGASWPSINISGNGTLSNVVVSSYASVSGRAVNMSDIELDFSSCIFRGCGYAIQGIARSKIIGGTITHCNEGVNLSSYGGAVIGTDISNCNYGVYLGTAASGGLIKDCTISQCGNTGVYMSQSHDVKVENCDFSDNNYDIQMDQYSGNILCTNNTHINPTIRSYDRSANSGAFIITNCSIDAPSIIKTFLQSSVDNYNSPQFLLQNSFGLTGAYYGKLEVVKDTGTVPASVRMKFNTGVSDNSTEFKVASTYTKGGVGKTLDFKLNAVSAGWIGNIIPKIKLNGVVIQTESTITSVSDGSDDSYSYTIPGASITEDGELSIEFLANCNTVAVRIKEFTVS